MPGTLKVQNIRGQDKVNRPPVINSFINLSNFQVLGQYYRIGLPNFSLGIKLKHTSVLYATDRISILHFTFKPSNGFHIVSYVTYPVKACLAG